MSTHWGSFATIAVGVLLAAPSSGAAASNAIPRGRDRPLLLTNPRALATNAVAVPVTTNGMRGHRDVLRPAPLHGGPRATPPGDPLSPILERIARVGAPLLLVEGDETYTLRDRSESSGVRTVRLGTDQFSALRRFLGWRQASDAGTPPTITFQTMVQWDAVEGTYEMIRVEIGLFGRRVWLIHERTAAQEESGMFGIQLRKEW